MSDKARAAQLKNLVGERLREENERANQVNNELKKLKADKADSEK